MFPLAPNVDERPLTSPMESKDDEQEETSLV